MKADTMKFRRNPMKRNSRIVGILLALMVFLNFYMVELSEACEVINIELKAKVDGSSGPYLTTIDWPVGQDLTLNFYAQAEPDDDPDENPLKWYLWYKDYPNSYPGTSYLYNSTRGPREQRVYSTCDDWSDFSEAAAATTFNHVYGSNLSVGTYYPRLLVERYNAGQNYCYCTINIIEVYSVSQDRTTACLSQNVTFTAISNPYGRPLTAIEWQRRYATTSAGVSSATYASASGGDNTAVLNTSTAGFYQYRARNGSGDSWKSSSVVEIKGWTSGPPISGAAIKKEHDQEWFHVSQSCKLRAKGHDYDSLCDVQQETDFIDLTATIWEGDGLVTYYGTEVVWSPGKYTQASGTPITAHIKDSASPADDPADAEASITMKAYEAKGTLNVQSINGNSWYVTVHEESGPSSENIQRYLSDTTEVATNSESDVFHAEALLGPDSGGLFAEATWDVVVEPGNISLTNCDLSLTYGVSLSAGLSCSVSDMDWDWSGCGVGIDISFPSFPIGVSITPNLFSSGEDDVEAQAAVTFGFNSEGLGQLLEDTGRKLARSSGDGNGTYSLPVNPYVYSYSTTIYKPYQNTTAKHAQARMAGKIEAKGSVHQDCTELECWDVYENSEASVTGVLDIRYDISAPFVKDPYLNPSPESGY